MTYLLYGLGGCWALIILDAVLSVTVAFFQERIDFREAIIILLSALGFPLLLLAGLTLLLFIKVFLEPLK